MFLSTRIRRGDSVVVSQSAEGGRSSDVCRAQLLLTPSTVYDANSYGLFLEMKLRASESRAAATDGSTVRSAPRARLILRTEEPMGTVKGPKRRAAEPEAERQTTAGRTVYSAALTQCCIELCSLVGMCFPRPKWPEGRRKRTFTKSSLPSCRARNTVERARTTHVCLCYVFINATN